MRWIKTNKRMPPENEMILFTVKYTEGGISVYYGFYYWGDWYVYGQRDGGQVDRPVDYWMPLPEPPKKGYSYDKI